MDRWGYLFCRGRIFSTLERDEHQYDDDCEVFWASGGCLMLRAACYHAVGGLDISLYAHMEEVDLCWRLKNAGYRIGYVGSSTVYHVGGSVISYGSPQKLFFNYRNSLILLLKNEPAGRLLWLLPWRMILDGVAACQMLVQGQVQGFLTVIKAHFAFYGQLRTWLQHRKQARSIIAATPNQRGRMKRSIVWAYFGRRKKKFVDLGWCPPGL